MKRVQARKLKGFQDYSHDVMLRRFAVMDEVRRVAMEAGFMALQTPAIEYAEVLLGEGGETDKQVFSWEDNGGRAVALRYDLTVPFSRFVAENGNLTVPYKRFQIGDVWRAEKPQKGRFREFCQCDFDIIGADTLSADVEIIWSIVKVLSSLKIGFLTMTLGHRDVLSGLLNRFLPDVLKNQGGEQASLIIIDKLDKIGTEKCIAELSALPGSNQNGSRQIIEFLNVHSKKASNDFSEIFELLTADEKALNGLKRIEDILRILTSLAAGLHIKVVADFKIARGLAYYTGMVFETTIDSLPEFGSISSGGRYNNLIERFVDRDLPGVGGSIGLDRLVAAIEEQGHAISQVRKGIFIVPTGDGFEGWAFQVAQYFRDQGMLAEMSVKSGKLGKQFALADKLQRAFAIVIGPDEFNSLTITVKDLTSGKQVDQISLDAARQFIEQIS